MAGPSVGDGDGDGDGRVWVGAVAGGVGTGRCGDGDVDGDVVGASCDEVTPAAPELTQAVCVDGVVTGPSLTLAATDEITYTR